MLTLARFVEREKPPPSGHARQIFTLPTESTGDRAAAAPGSGRPASPRRRLALLPAFSLLLGALSPFAAATASADVLVSNIGQTAKRSGQIVGFMGIAVAQQFTTGSTGSTLTSIEFTSVGEVSASDRPTLRVELWSSASNGTPDSKLASLTVPSTVGRGNVSFAALPNISLAANTSYFAVMYGTSASAITIGVATTESDAEDSGAASGWSIANNGYRRISGTWSAFANHSLKIRVNGAAQATQSSDATLSALTGTTSTDGTNFSGTLSFGTFASTTETYTASVAHSVTHVKLTPTKTHIGASIKVGKTGSLQTAPSGTPSGAIALDVGANAIGVEVTAQDGTKNSYTVTVTRAEAETERQVLAPACTAETGPLCGLALTAGSETVTLDPAFRPGRRSYQAEVPAGTHRVSLTPTWGGTASVFVGARAPWYEEYVHRWKERPSYTHTTRVRPSGTAVEINLAPSGRATELYVMVFGAGGTNTEYEIDVTEARPALSADATLSALTGTTSEDGAAFPGALVLSPAFAPGTTAYTATVGHAVTHARLTPTVNEAGATVTVAGTAVASGTGSDALALAVGANALQVEVTAEDGTRTT